VGVGEEKKGEEKMKKGGERRMVREWGRKRKKERRK
jgi:hypothetical protein